MNRILPDTRIDWFRILTDLCSDGYSMYDLARDTSIPRSSLQSYKQGVEPLHAIGMCVLAHWSMRTGKSGADAPRVPRYPQMSVRHRRAG